MARALATGDQDDKRLVVVRSADAAYQDAVAGLVEALQWATMEQGGQGVDQEQGRAEDKGRGR